MACVFAIVILAKQSTIVYQGCCINRLFLHEAATRFSTHLSTHLMSNFTDSLHIWLIKCWVVVHVWS